jgi:alcohol dehydrogenase class IV
VLRWNEGVASDRQKLVAALLGNASLSASDAVRALARALDLPTDLAAIGIVPGQFRAIAEHTLHDRGIRSNPRPIMGADDIIEILELARGTRGGRS